VWRGFFGLETKWEWRGRGMEKKGGGRNTRDHNGGSSTKQGCSSNKEKAWHEGLSVGYALALL